MLVANFFVFLYISIYIIYILYIFNIHISSSRISLYFYIFLCILNIFNIHICSSRISLYLYIFLCILNIYFSAEKKYFLIFS